MKEKVLWLELPEGVKYQRLIVTEKGRIGIVYSEDSAMSQSVEIGANEILNVKIPKPEKLIGGTEVYQKQGIPYWYCRIKNGRDEFMHIYMNDLTKEDLYNDFKTGKIRHFETKREQDFRDNVLEALENKPKEGGRWLSTFEPSSNRMGGLQFVQGEKPLVGLNCLKWEKLMKRYSPHNESCMSSMTTYFLLQLRWLKDGIVTLEQLVDNSTDIGHYLYSTDTKNEIELTGKREFGGLCGLIGNTCKIIKFPDSECGFALVGGSFLHNGSVFPVADVDIIGFPDTEDYQSVGLIEIKR